ENAACDRQAQTRPTLTALGRDEGLEDPANEVRRDALAVVFDPNFHPLSVLFRADPDVPPLAHCVPSVEEDVGQNLLQVVKVPTGLGVRDSVHVNRDLFWLQKV